MYIRIYYNKIFAIASEIINLRNKENGIEIDPQYFTDITFEDAISLYEFDVNDFMIYDTIIPIHTKDSYLRDITELEWSKWTDPRDFRAFEFENVDLAHRVLHSNITAKMVCRFKPPMNGIYKILIGYGSTVIGTFNGILDVGYERLNGSGYDLLGYINNVTFDLVCDNASEMKVAASSEFTITNDKEIVVARWTKTTNNGTGYLYMHPFILKRVI